MIKIVLLVVTTFFCGYTSTAQADPAKMNLFVSKLLKKMTLEEKIGQLNLVTPGGGIATGAVVSNDVEGKIRNGSVGGLFGIHGPDKIRQAQDLAVKHSRLHIPLLFGSDVIHGYQTTFPIPLGLACSWDMELIQSTARIAAQEATANGLNWTFSPMVDIARDPRWGRVAEGAGEDPYLGSRIAAAMVKGYQGNDLSKNNTLLSCVKHFALYGAAEGGRDYNTVDMSRVKMYEYYLPPYKAAVMAGAGSVMTSFNEIDGIPATGNKWLLTDVLRKEWGFKGLVVSDYTSVNEMINHGSGNLQEVSAQALKAGLDMDMVGEGFLTTLKKSLDQKKVTLLEIDKACTRILEAKYKLGLFDDPYRYIDEKRPATEIMTEANRAVARLAATRSVVLLKNKNNVLPLNKNQKILLVGPLANDKRNMLGTWSVSGEWEKSISVLEGFKNVAGKSAPVVYMKGANITDDTLLAKQANVFGLKVETDPMSPSELIRQAVEAASNSNVIVVVLGEASEMSGEAASRTDISLPQSQKDLLEALYKTGKPIVAVIMSGRPLALERENEISNALVQAWFCGTESGNAIADVLYGNYNPSGKLTMSFPKNVGQIPIYYNYKNTGRPFDAGNKFTSKYLDVSNEPLFAFGYGLSYTTFSYGNIELNKKAIHPGEKLEAKVKVSNTGDYDGEETVQLYIRDLVSSVTRPVKELKGFQKIMLKKGESKTVTFTVTSDDLKFYNNSLKYIFEPGQFKIYIGGNSIDTKEESFELLAK